MMTPWILSMCVGFLSLSQEILWMRYVGFAGQTVPWAFSFVLMIYLVGIARGAMIGSDYCKKTTKLYTVAGRMLLISGVLDIIGPFVAPLPKIHYSVILFIYLCALLKSIVFPIVHHLGATPEPGKVGKSVSRVYFMNIIGATLGPLVTGFWLVDRVSLQTAMVLMGVLTCLLGFFCIAKENNKKATAVAALVVMIASGAFFLPNLLTDMLVCIPTHTTLRHVIETRAGIIDSAQPQSGGDYTYGDNVYDGRTNIDPAVNSNGLQRLFVLAAIKPHPARILEIGLSSGAWARILSGFPGFKHMDVVEINAGYLKLIPDYPEIAPILKDPRIHIHIDDGRRWLKRHPEEKYDLIVMNTTWHWRTFSTNLLSQQFLRIVRRHLLPGGVLAYNSTHSPDVLKTASTVFPYAFEYYNFVVASDRDFRPLQKTGRERLLAIRLDGKPLLDPHNKKDAAFINDTLQEAFLTVGERRKYDKRAGEVITDWNMITEFKYGRHMTLFCGKYGYYDRLKKH